MRWDLGTGLYLLSQTAFALSGPPQLGQLLQSQPRLSTFYACLLQYPSLLFQFPDQAGITLIAPSNKAFQNIPGTSLNGIWDSTNGNTTIPILEYHVLRDVVAMGAIVPGPTVMRPTLLTDVDWTNVTNGQNVLINKQPSGNVVFESGNGARCSLITGDLVFAGGLVQIVDNLLIPPLGFENAAANFDVMGFLGLLWDTALMPYAVEAPDTTMFVPLDVALQLVAQSLQGLSAVALRQVAGYHIVPNQVLSSSDLKNGTALATSGRRQGDNSSLSLTIRQSGNNIYVNTAQLIQPDILIGNGIFHIIDNVLNPDASAAIPNPKLVSQPPVYGVGTTLASTLPFATAIPCTLDCPQPTISSSAVASSSSLAPEVFTTTSKGAAATVGPNSVPQFMGAAIWLAGIGMGFAAIG